MIFHQYFLSCLSHASYLIGDESSGLAVVVDPQRDVSGYQTDADAAGLRITRVIETHVHADFLSGHLELAGATGAAICFGEGITADFPVETLADGQLLGMGRVTIEVRATPGHTPESISLVVYDHPSDEVAGGAPWGVLTGDTLFVGDVGRPDLLASQGASADRMARALYHSLHERLLTLPDATRVFPAHGSGSACGRSLSTETSSTVGQQRRTNDALAPMSEDDFVALVTEGQPTAPAYFGYSSHRNREVRPLLDEHRPPAAMGLDDVVAATGRGAVVLDTRDPADFAPCHLRRSLNVGLEGRFAEYAGDVLHPDDDLVLLCDDGRQLEAAVRLARIGFDRVAGAMADPAAALAGRPDLSTASERIPAPVLAERLARGEDLVVVDVRDAGERSQGAVPGSRHVPLASLLDRMGELDFARPVVTYCASGYRSSIAASLLARNGHPGVADLLGGYDAWRRAATPGGGTA
ncbi:MAG: MBL fold metallo-hydrolase [Acidimicrobiales bacterium]